MPPLDWTAFDSLPGSKSKNFENLCRGLMRLHFGRFGDFRALSNQPGVEFHIKLQASCTLGGPPQWFGWQCKVHRRTQSGDLAASSRNDIEESLRTTENLLPGLTDWILWTPYTLSKKDQEWFYSLKSNFRLILWAEEELDTYLNGDGLLLRATYFGELILTPTILESQHRVAIQPIRDRWLPQVHQSVQAERTIRQMLGEPGSWDQLIEIGERLAEAIDVITKGSAEASSEFKSKMAPFISACSSFADTLLRFHEILEVGDLDVIWQKLDERNTLIGADVRSVPRFLRKLNQPIAIEATNALADLQLAKDVLDKAEELLGIGLVALVVDAGGGKTQISAQVTASQEGRPAGILLLGRDFHKGNTLDDLAHHFSVNGNPITSMEKLIAALDSAGKRSGSRLPLIIDGLNEAENPKEWKTELARLFEILKRYPNALVICTLRTGERRREEQGWRPDPKANDRESFAIMSLPNNITKIESEGFGGDVNDAVDKYFEFFKINANGTEIPIEILQHPLTLRIFCEVTNPKRETEVVVDYIPASIPPLFEKYIAMACERISQMPHLSYNYTTDEVHAAIYSLGLELWTSKKREIGDEHYRNIVSDSGRSWDSSIVNLLAQEGIIFRNPGTEPGKFVITPTYDALGGYIIAKALILKHSNDRDFSWLKEEISYFIGEDATHELAYDIYTSLVTLTPRYMQGMQLWKKAPDPLRNAALVYSTGLEADYIDGETTRALLDLLFSYKPSARGKLFNRLQSLRAANHPYNSDFLGTALQSMSVSERDLSWTEWIRDTRKERFEDILAMESIWKSNANLRTTSDRFRARWFMWHLTSTDRELRDITTRALYWFGRGNPEFLFEDSLKSLSINDPYIPERMLAASYGVAMARHVDYHDNNFKISSLPTYAISLYKALFKEEAPFGTTHILLREYASRTIELALIYNPTLLSPEEIARTQPTFNSAGFREWGISDHAEDEIHGPDSPFRMDFENYTIGSLMPGRHNYDYKHEGYRKIRAQILWRIEQLGWSRELFKDIDSMIERSRHWPRVGSDATKIDRYGKKYSWIAYYEMSGLLHDQGILENCRERTSNVDIDPSFPEPVSKGRIIDSDFLGDPGMEMKEWIARGPMPNIDPFLQLARVNNEDGPWLTLDGYVTQQDNERGRQLFCFIRSFLVETRVADAFLDHFSKQDLGGRWLPEKPNFIYVFAGEIPWCKTFPENGPSEFSFVVGKNLVKVMKKEKDLYLDGKKLAMTEMDLILQRLFKDRKLEGPEENTFLTREDIERIDQKC